MAISDLGYFWFLTPTIPKNHLFWKNGDKVNNFQNFQKTEYIVVELAVFTQCAKFQLNKILFGPKSDVFVFPIVSTVQ